jgi:iron complex outermembrane receptor protein
MNKVCIDKGKRSFLKGRLRSGAAVLAASTVLVGSPALAQDEKEESTSIFGTDVIIVTAQKREQNAQDVPIAITAIGGAQVEALGYVNAEEISVQVPGLIATSYSGGGTVSLFSVRGIGQNDFAEHQEAPVAIYNDGVYVANTSAAGIQLFDIDRLEILKGPQGTLFGRNATGGLVHAISARPTDFVEGYVSLTVGSYNQISAEGAISGPITDNLLGRVSFLSDNADGYFKDLSGGEDSRARNNQSVRAQLEWSPTPNTTFSLLARYNHTPRTPNGVYDMRPSDGVNVGGGLVDFLGVPDEAPGANEGFIDYPGYLGKESQSYEFTSEIDLDSGLTITSITSYGEVEKEYFESDTTSGPGGAFIFNTAHETQQFSQELRLNGDTDRLKYQLGVYFLDLHGDYFTDDEFSHFGGRVLNNYSLGTESWSVFGELEYELTNNLSVIAGARWVSDKKDYTINSECVSPRVNTTGEADCFFWSSGDPAAPIISEIGAPVTQSRSDDLYALNFKLNLDVTEDLMLYAGYSRGVKGGGFNAPVDGFLTANELSFDPEVLNSYEAGFKSNLFGNTVILNGSAFYYDYQDYQGFVFEGLTTQVVNLPAEVYGGELELAVSPGDGWYLSLGVSALDATVEDSAATAVFEGPNMITAPELSINTLLRKEWDFENGTFAAQFDGGYVSEQEFNTNNSALSTTPGYSLWNGRLTYSSSSDGWEVSLFAKNIFNKEYQTYRFDLTGFAGQVLYLYGPPRWFGGEVKYSF